jgi:hypothetical protein
MNDSRLLVLTFVAALGLAAESSVAFAACPGVGEVLMTYKDAEVPLPAATADLLPLMADSCDENPSVANMATAKLVIKNRTSAPQTAECTFGSTQSWDSAQVTVPASGSAVLVLQVASSGGLEDGGGKNVLRCRNAEPNSDSNLVASWIKIVTRGVRTVVYEAVP